MILNYIFLHLNAIILITWLALLLIVFIRFTKGSWVKNISYKKLVIITFCLNIFYAVFITWGQYYVWATGNIVSKTFVNSPLPKEVPFPYFLEWVRPLFENYLGYFMYYVLGRFWLYIFLLFIISVALYFLLKLWGKYRGGFTEDGPLLILILMLISGWPGVLLFVPLGFIFSILYLLFSYILGKKNCRNRDSICFSLLNSVGLRKGDHRAIVVIHKIGKITKIVL